MGDIMEYSLQADQTIMTWDPLRKVFPPPPPQGPGRLRCVIRLSCLERTTNCLDKDWTRLDCFSWKLVHAMGKDRTCFMSWLSSQSNHVVSIRTTPNGGTVSKQAW